MMSPVCTLPKGEGAVSPCSFRSKEIISTTVIVSSASTDEESRYFQPNSIGTLSLWERVRSH